MHWCGAPAAGDNWYRCNYLTRAEGRHSVVSVGRVGRPAHNKRWNGWDGSGDPPITRRPAHNRARVGLRVVGWSQTKPPSGTAGLHTAGHKLWVGLQTKPPEGWNGWDGSGDPPITRRPAHNRARVGLRVVGWSQTKPPEGTAGLHTAGHKLWVGLQTKPPEGWNGWDGSGDPPITRRPAHNRARVGLRVVGWSQTKPPEGTAGLHTAGHKLWVGLQTKPPEGWNGWDGSGDPPITRRPAHNRARVGLRVVGWSQTKPPSGTAGLHTAGHKLWVGLQTKPPEGWNGWDGSGDPPTTRRPAHNRARVGLRPSHLRGWNGWDGSGDPPTTEGWMGRVGRPAHNKGWNGWDGSGDPPITRWNGWDGSGDPPITRWNGWDGSGDPPITRGGTDGTGRETRP